MGSIWLNIKSELGKLLVGNVKLVVMGVAGSPVQQVHWAKQTFEVKTAMEIHNEINEYTGFIGTDFWVSGSD